MAGKKSNYRYNTKGYKVNYNMEDLLNDWQMNNISTDEISKKLGIQRKSVREMVRNHKEILLEFGNIYIKRTPIPNGRPRISYLLNQIQTQIIFSFARSFHHRQGEKAKVNKIVELSEAD